MATHDKEGGLSVAEQPGDCPFDCKMIGATADWFGLADSAKNRAVRISIMEQDGESCLGTALVTRAEESGLQELSGLPSVSLEKAMCISDIAIDPVRSDVLPVVLYMALRRGRIWGRSTVAAYIADPQDEGPAILGLERLTNARPYRSLLPSAQVIDYAAYRAFNAASLEMRCFIQSQFVSESIETLERWLEQFFKSPWFQSIYDGTLSRRQYIRTLEQQHQYVRYTTRLIAGALSWSEDRELRDHWRHHLQGEVNHELIIEKDLANLGADVNYAVDSAIPHPMNLQFIMAQESIVGFRRNPVLLLSSAFVAEGFSSHLDQTFVDALYRVASSWGVKNPRLVTNFITSHIDYDGGADGHWAGICTVLGQYLESETEQQTFLAIIRLCMDAFDRSYSAYIGDLLIFAAKPESVWSKCQGARE
jgi:hypothetical protein